jgi:hypothetical protein
MTHDVCLPVGASERLRHCDGEKTTTGSMVSSHVRDRIGTGTGYLPEVPLAFQDKTTSAAGRL